MRRLIRIFVLLAFFFAVYRIALDYWVDGYYRDLRRIGYPATLAELNAVYSLPAGSENAADAILETKPVFEAKKEDRLNLEFRSGIEMDSEALLARLKAGEISQNEYREELDKAMREREAREEAEAPQQTPDYWGEMPSISAAPLPNAWREGLKREVEARAAAFAPLRRAAAIGTARYPGDFTQWHENSPGLLNHIWTVMDGARLLCLQAILDADAGDASAAARNIADALSIAETLKYEPAIMSQLVRYAALGQAQTAIAYTLTRSGFSLEQMKALDAQLAAIAFEEDLARAIAGEMCLMRDGFKIGDARPEADNFFADTELDDSSGLSNEEEEALEADLPTGRWRLIYEIPYKIAGLENWDKRFVLKDIMPKILTARAPMSSWIDAMQAESAEPDREPPAFLLLADESMLPNMRMLYSPMRAEMRFRMLRAAFTIERWRLEHGALPDSRDETTAQPDAVWPEDLFDGAALRYRRTAPGYIVYSVGMDHDDDNGIPAETGCVCEGDWALEILRG